MITLELASVCLKKLRAHARQRDVLIAAFQMMTRLDIDTSPIEHTEVILLAERTGLTVYDACYLWLANELHCELLTLDKKLTAASRK